MSGILIVCGIVVGTAILAAGIGLSSRYAVSRVQWSRERRQRPTAVGQEIFARYFRNAPTSDQGTIICPLCGCPQPCQFQSRSFSCRKCERTFDFLACSKCAVPQVHRRSISGICRNCSRRIRCSLFWDFLHLSNPGAFVSFAELIGRDPAAQADDPQLGDAVETPRLVLRRLVVMNGAGWAPQVGSLARLLLFEERIEITPRDQRSRP